MKNPKNCTIKVYVYNTVVDEYQYLKSLMTLPTFSQAFEKFLEENDLDELLTDCKVNYKLATPFTIPVNCETKRKWDSFTKAEKGCLMLWFNSYLWSELCYLWEVWLAKSFYGGLGV